MKQKREATRRETFREQNQPDLFELLNMARLYRDLGQSDRADLLYAQLVVALHAEHSERDQRMPTPKGRRHH